MRFRSQHVVGRTARNFANFTNRAHDGSPLHVGAPSQYPIELVSRYRLLWRIRKLNEFDEF
jgi:hypothetical protein